MATTNKLLRAITRRHLNAHVSPSISSCKLLNAGATRLGYTLHEARTVVLFRNFDEELKCPGVWETDQGATSTTDASRDNLATLYRLPFALMYHGLKGDNKSITSPQSKGSPNKHTYLLDLQFACRSSLHHLHQRPLQITDDPMLPEQNPFL
ncbi:hypothetical protein L6452_17440 [Arctium lappa]|uniref:Uncharacterized protein n=1 Tax=Arctium lappa TaxID=4217 RepID=A0ACB9C3F1_ARCLA|nr:hypothetical protein L6452_17440 [Arctium lappa]